MPSGTLDPGLNPGSGSRNPAPNPPSSIAPPAVPSTGSKSRFGSYKYSSGDIKTAADFKRAATSGETTNAGAIGNINTLLNGLKSDVQAGKLTLTDYNKIVQPNSQFIVQGISGGMSGGSNSASQATQAGGYDILNNFFKKDDSGQFQPTIPFSSSEYAQLPNNVLPTQDDINKGLFDPTTAPLNRIQTTPDQQNPQGGPQTVGGLPGVNTSRQTVNSGGIQPDTTPGSVDEQKLANEAELAKQLRDTQLAQNQTKGSDYINQMAQLLQKQQDAQFKYDEPGIMEDLNSRGLLRSSGLGQALGREQALLTANTTSQLGQFGLGLDTKNLETATGNTNSYISDRQAALGRNFSIDDFYRSLTAAKDLGSTTTPQVQGKSTGQQIATGIGTAASAAQAGAAVAGK